MKSGKPQPTGFPGSTFITGAMEKSLNQDPEGPKRHPSNADRLAGRQRPEGWPIMHQSWDKLLFLHWQMPMDAIRNLIPKPLEIDTFDGKAWLSITPLTIYDARPVLVPSVPYLSWLHELNVRTYVHYDGLPGVWFFSLDANNLPAVLGARLFFELPYFSAEISLETEGNRVSFRSKRSEGPAKFAADWEIGKPLPSAEPGTLDFFLLERYSLYTADDMSIKRCRIHHQPWPLQKPERLSSLESNMAGTAGLPEPVGQPLLHCGGPVDVDVWPLEKVAERT